MDRRRKLPSINKLIEDERLKRYSRALVKEVVKQEVEEVRRRLKEENLQDNLYENIINSTLKTLQKEKFNLVRVINATGVVLNTNLGRAPLSEWVIERVGKILTKYSNLEVDLRNGKRFDRNLHLKKMIQKLTGGEDCVVVNNNAGAVYLILNTFAKNKEVIISRGELIEIGGNFRLPEVIGRSGAKIVEVGTTNRTYLKDYEEKINENTAILLKSHTSNYKIVGFCTTPTLKELKQLGEKYHLLTVMDLGSGLFIDLKKYGLPYEPVVSEVISSGVDVVTFSGDKLLGGPQAGIIIGKEGIIKELKKNPIYRILRVDKYTLATLETILWLYLYDEEVIAKIPPLKMITQPLSLLKQRAEKIVTKLNPTPKGIEVKVENSYSQIGGGSYPGVELPTYVVSLCGIGLDVITFYSNLLNSIPPILGRIKENKLLLDVRTIFDEEVEEVVRVVRLNYDKSIK